MDRPTSMRDTYRTGTGIGNGSFCLPWSDGDLDDVIMYSIELVHIDFKVTFISCTYVLDSVFSHSYTLAGKRRNPGQMCSV
jgi:hypothetical protein